MSFQLIKPSLVLALLMLVAGGCASLPPNVDRSESFALRDTDKTSLGIASARHQSGHPDHSGFHLLASGLDAFVARAVLAHYAESSIDAQYYLFHGDLVGRLFIDLLLKAADRGVRVRLLVDDMAISSGDIGAAALNAHPNFEVRIFNPFGRNVTRLSQYVTRFGSVTRRMHNKSFTVDNQATIVGGRNIGNEYFDADPELAFADLDFIAIGPVVDEVSNAFDLYWNAEVTYPVSTLVVEPPSDAEIAEKRQALDDFVAEQKDSEYLQALQNSRLANLLRDGTYEYEWGGAHIIYDDPAKVTSSRDQTELHLSTQLKTHTQSISKELIIFSPYFVPGVEGAANLRALAESGVRVRILTNSLASTDVSAVHAGYAKYRKTLLQGGGSRYTR